MSQTVGKKKARVPAAQRAASKPKRTVSAPGAMEIVWMRNESRLKFISVGLAGVVALFALYSVVSSNGFAGFPFDDAWIHLTFARTLAATGRFAYGALHTATSGSTSPLFTFLESLIFLVTKNEFVVALIPSILGFVASAFLFYLLVREFTNLPWLPLAGTVLFIATPSLLLISNWGMETSLAIALLLWAILAYRREQWISLAFALGLAVWARPDTIVLTIAIAVDYFYSRMSAISKPGAKAILLFLAFALLYVGFNFILSGTVLPNTFYAKLAYYSGGKTEFWTQLWQLIAGGGKIIAFLLAVVGIGWSIPQKRRGNIALVLYPIGMIVLYRWKLPYLFQDGRYLIPILPFVLLLAVIGAARSASWFAKSVSVASTLALTLILAATIGAIAGMSGAVENLAYEDSYIHHLQVTTAKWCANNLPPKAVIATHDIGALGYYSNRRIVDLVGLANPGMIPYLKKPGAATALWKKGVTYAALLDNWYEIPNENTVFVDAPPESETMRVYFFSDSTRFTSAKVLPIHRYLYDVLRGADPSQFEEAMREAVAYEPDNALTYTLGGEIMLAMNKKDAAKSYFHRALELFPSSTRALRDLGLCNGLQAIK